MSVAATLRRDAARASSVRTCAGEESGRTAASLTVVRSVRGSWWISCFFLSNSCFPRRSLMVSLYYARDACQWAEKREGRNTYDFEELALHRVFPAF